MAGVVPKKSSSGRKQWTLHDGSGKNSLKRLRSHLASEGCAESQVVLAKQLLDDTQYEFESDKKENARIGVYWLIKASEQGNTEATDLLKSCFESGKGISEHNYMDVKSCITMTQDEKLARKAAKEMFASLSNGGDYITSNQLQKKILSIDKNREVIESKLGRLDSGDASNSELVNNYEDTDESEEDTDWSEKSETPNEKLTEENLVSAAVDYAHGQLPSVNNILCLTEPNLKALDHIPYVHRSILHPYLVLKILYFKFIRFLGKKLLLFFPLAKTELQLLFLLFIYSFVNSENTLYFLPMLVYYVSFLAMMVTTCQMLQSNREFLDFRLWSGLFICYSGGSLNASDIENQYVCNNLKPYGHFFLALLVNLVIYSVIAEQWIPQSELTIISFCLTFMTLLGFMPKRKSRTVYDGVILLSFAINVLAKYPYEGDTVVTQGWRFLDVNVPTFASYVVGNGIEFCLNFRLVLYAVIPVLFVKIASKQNWKGTYRMLIPHCVTLSWLQICIISSQGATMYGLMRGTLALVGVALFLPLVGITSVLVPAIAVTKWLLSSNILYAATFFLVLFCAGYAVSLALAQTRFKHSTALAQVFIMAIASCALLKNNLPEQFNKVPKLLSWETYQRFCHQPVWEDENVALAQIACSELQNSMVRWDGYINDVKVASVSNNVKSLVDAFPSVIGDVLACYFGEEYDLPCDKLTDRAKAECLVFYDTIKSTNICSLQKYNKYTFVITLKMQSGIWGKSPEVTVIVEDCFKNFTTKLKPGDHIWFNGYLFNNNEIGPDGILGGVKPHIRLDQMGCIACQNSKLTDIKKEAASTYSFNSVLSYLYVSCKFVLNILLNPIIVLK